MALAYLYFEHNFIKKVNKLLNLLNKLNMDLNFCVPPANNDINYNEQQYLLNMKALKKIIFTRDNNLNNEQHIFQGCSRPVGFASRVNLLF